MIAISVGLAYHSAHRDDLAQRFDAARAPIQQSPQPQPRKTDIPVGTNQPPAGTQEPALARLTVFPKAADGAALATTVILKSESSNPARTYSCATSFSGTSCSLNNLPPGIYALDATSAALSYRRTGMRIHPRADLTLAITLTMGKDTGPDPALIAKRLANAKNEFESGSDNCAALHQFEEIIRETQGKPALSDYNTQARNDAEQVKKENSNLGVSCDQ